MVFSFKHNICLDSPAGANTYLPGVWVVPHSTTAISKYHYDVLGKTNPKIPTRRFSVAYWMVLKLGIYSFCK